MTAAILTISDSSAQGQREDLSGPALKDLLANSNFRVRTEDCIVVPDEIPQIKAAIIALAERVRLIVTTGGTGLSPRDVTPEATAEVCQRLIPGLSEVMRHEGRKTTEFAALSRGVCGVIGKSLVVNLPGNPAGAVESLTAILHLVPHALELLEGRTEHSSARPKR